MRRSSLILLLAAACGSTADRADRPQLRSQATREDVVDIRDALGATLDLGTRAGDVEIVVAEGPPRLVARLTLMARSEGEAEELLSTFRVAAGFVQDACVVRAEGEPAELPGTRTRVEPLLTFLATVPPGQRLRAESGSGRVEVKGAAGDCWLETSFGDVSASGIRAERVRAKTGSGVVRLEDVAAASVEVDTAFGNISLVRVRGDVSIEAGSGNVTLEAFSGGRCALETGFGDVTATGSFVDLSAKTSSGRIDITAERGSRVERAWSLRSSFGDVVVSVPREFDCELFAETSFGSVTSDAEVERRGERHDRRLRGAIGQGGGRLTLRTSSGDIRIRIARPPLG